MTREGPDFNTESNLHADTVTERYESRIATPCELCGATNLRECPERQEQRCPYTAKLKAAARLLDEFPGVRYPEKFTAWIVARDVWMGLRSSTPSATASTDPTGESHPWIGCGECDPQFICHGGEHACVRWYRSTEKAAQSATASKSDLDKACTRIEAAWDAYLLDSSDGEKTRLEMEYALDQMARAIDELNERMVLIAGRAEKAERELAYAVSRSHDEIEADRAMTRALALSETPSAKRLPGKVLAFLMTCAGPAFNREDLRTEAGLMLKGQAADREAKNG